MGFIDENASLQSRHQLFSDYNETLILVIAKCHQVTMCKNIVDFIIKNINSVQERNKKEKKIQPLKMMKTF